MVTREFGELKLKMCSSYGWIWDDSGSGASMSATVYNVQSNSTGEGGYRPLGHYCQGDYNYNNPKMASIVVKPSSKASQSNPPLASPVNYSWAYDDSGTGGKHNLCIWNPNPPPGYVALGCIANNNWQVQPSVNEIYVVRQDLVKQGLAGEKLWSDQGSGGKHNCNLFKIVTPTALSALSDFNHALIAPGTFMCANHYNTPTPTAVTNLLWLPVPKEEQINNIQLPRLTSRDRPPAETLPTQERAVLIPMNAVVDNDRNLAWKVANSPFYKLVRTTTYKLLLYNNNFSSVNQSIADTFEYGTSKTQSESFSVKTGIEISYSTGVKVAGAGVGITASFSLELGYETATSVTSFESRSVKKNLDVAPNHSGALWTIYDKLKVVRADGSEIANLSYTPDTTAVVTDSYPSP